MPRSDAIVYLRGFRVESVSGSNPVHIRVRYTEPSRCIRCQSDRLRIKASFDRRIRHESLGCRVSYLLIRGRKYVCLDCGRYFRERYPGILPYQRATERFREEVSRKHHQGISQRTLSQTMSMSWSTVERWYHHFLEREYAEIKNNPAPHLLGLDEHFFSKKQGYASTFCDLRKHKVHDVVLGRSKASLNQYLSRMPKKDQTQVAVIDLSDTYRRIIRDYFPNAKIVADRFHTIRLVNHHFLNAWKQLDPEGRKNRGLLSLMRRHEDKLRTDQKTKLRQYLKAHGPLETIYDFKQKLCKLLTIKHRTAKQCKKLIPKLLAMIEQLKQAPVEALSVLGQTLDDWQEEIARMWRFTKTNGITEGLHTKMELIQRRAYGFRNFNNYRLRVKALCG